MCRVESSSDSHRRTRGLCSCCSRSFTAAHDPFHRIHPGPPTTLSTARGMEALSGSLRDPLPEFWLESSYSLLLSLSPSLSTQNPNLHPAPIYPPDSIHHAITTMIPRLHHSAFQIVHLNAVCLCFPKM